MIHLSYLPISDIKQLSYVILLLFGQKYATQSLKDSYSMKSELSNAVSDAFQRRLDNFPNNNKYPHGITF